VTEGNGSIVSFSPPGGVVASVSLNSSNFSTFKPTLDELKNVTLGGLLNNSTISYALVSSNSTSVAGLPAYILNLNASASGIAFQQQVVMTMKDYQGYVLYYSAAQGVFPDYQQDFNNMTSSFAITG